MFSVNMCNIFWNSNWIIYIISSTSLTLNPMNQMCSNAITLCIFNGIYHSIFIRYVVLRLFILFKYRDLKKNHCMKLLLPTLCRLMPCNWNHGGIFNRKIEREPHELFASHPVQLHILYEFISFMKYVQ